ncbi:MAG: cupredoxin domain-containing protein [Candidatus Omnitrophica bacterium]|nr:cupredoxin domain-containing protein [Candidatus Omnitrophota bacterium]MDD5236388.1 cupredoxin domain-containing protein [Candidatus Omnitrophota bacterium]MDD5610680.1 cupredoxin domain-containing protein [Candidatus Omnitrophota bacterium]
MKKYYLATAIFSFMLLIGAGYIASGNAQKEDLKLSGEVKDGVRVIEVKASKYKYEPDPIVVKEGERVRIVATSSDVAHGFALAEFKVNLTIDPGKTAVVEFVADKAGKFSAYCSIYCGAGHEHMRGDFIVLK